MLFLFCLFIRHSPNIYLQNLSTSTSADRLFLHTASYLHTSQSLPYQLPKKNCCHSEINNKIEQKAHTHFEKGGWLAFVEMGFLLSWSPRWHFLENHVTSRLALTATLIHKKSATSVPEWLKAYMRTRDRQTDRERAREREREAHRQTDAHRKCFLSFFLSKQKTTRCERKCDTTRRSIYPV